MSISLVAFSVQFQQVASVIGLQQNLQVFLQSVGTDAGPALAVVLMMLMILMVGAITESIVVVRLFTWRSSPPTSAGYRKTIRICFSLNAPPDASGLAGR